MKKNLFLLAIILLTSLLYSCEYDLTDNYVHIDEPTEAAVSIDLNVIKEGQSLIVNKESDIEFALTAFEKEVNSAIFKMGEKEWVFTNQEEGVISITKEDFPAGEYTLTCDLFVKTNSGSIADQQGVEYLSQSLSWPVVIDYELSLPATVVSSIRDGFLELSWSEPTLSYLKVKGYQVHYKSEEVDREKAIEETTELVFTDKNYVGEAATYQVFMELTNEEETKTHLWPMGSIEMTKQFKYYTSSNINEIEIRWENPIKNSLTILVDNEKVNLLQGQTYLRLPTTDQKHYLIELNLASYDYPDKTLISHKIVTKNI